MDTVLNPPSSKARPHSSSSNTPMALWVVVILIFTSVVAYSNIRQQSFFHYDDNLYVIKNPYAHQYALSEGLKWSLAAGLLFKIPSGNDWQPITVMSRMLDFYLPGYQENAVFYVNLLIHVMNGLIVFSVLNMATRRIGRSAVVALIFCLHPIQVESVAWAASRKELLYAFFGLLAIGFYVRFRKRIKTEHYLIISICFTLSLLSKQMLVTLPVFFVLLDVWAGKQVPFAQRPNHLWESIARNIPYLTISVLFSGMTLYFYQGTLELGAFSEKMVRAVHAYVFYLKQLLPMGHGIYAPIDATVVPTVQTIGYAIFLICMTGFAIAVRNTRAYICVGWIGFVVGLLPVIGLNVPADRYMYFVMIWPTLLIVWSISDFFNRFHWSKSISIVIVFLCILGLVKVTSDQVKTWSDAKSVFRHALNLNPQNALIHNALGHFLLQENDYERARHHFTQAIEIEPSFTEGYQNLGVSYASQNQWSAAEKWWQRALKIEPDDVTSLYHLGKLEIVKGNPREAIKLWEKALDTDPSHLLTHLYLAKTWNALNHVEQSLYYYQRMLVLDPVWAEPRNNLGVILMRQDRVREAIVLFEQAIKLNPNYADAFVNLGTSYIRLKQYHSAWDAWNRALEIVPNHPVVMESLPELQKRI